MEFRELVLRNRTYRRFDEGVSISKEELLRLVDLARLTPSAANLQHIRYILVNEADISDKIYPFLGWAGYLKDWSGPPSGERPSAYILMLVDEGAVKKAEIDVGISAQTIMLGATELGYGGCIVGNLKRDEIKKALSIDEKYHLVLVLALGAPIEKVVLKDVESDGSVKYFRDESGVHYVPKRKLVDIVL